MTGWWVQPLWKILVSWYHYSLLFHIMEHKKCLKPPTRMIFWYSSGIESMFKQSQLRYGWSSRKTPSLFNFPSIAPHPHVSFHGHIPKRASLTDDFVLVALLYKQLPLPDLKTWRKKMISKFHQPCSPEPESEKSVYTQFGELLSIALKAVEWYLTQVTCISSRYFKIVLVYIIPFYTNPQKETRCSPF
jgi:hypothetical protein